MRKGFLIICSLFLVSTVWASPTTTIAVPNSFTAGTTAIAAQVNADFNEVSNQFNSHSHEDITKLGSVTVGSWLATPVSTTYGGTGQDFSASTTGSIPYFSGAGVLSTLSAGSNGQVLQTQGAGSPPKWASSIMQDSIVRGLELDLQAGNVVASSGVVFVGSTGVNCATTSTMVLATAGHWSSGSTVVYGSEDWCYVGVNNIGSVKLLGKTPPRTCDINNTTQGTKYYLYDSGYWWRVIGAFRENGGAVTQNWKQDGNYVQWDSNIASLVLSSAVSSGAWSANIPCTALMPAISTRAVFGAYSAHAGITGTFIRPDGSAFGLTSGATDTDGSYGVSGYANGANCEAGGEITSLTSLTQGINIFNFTATTATQVILKGYYLNIR